MYISHRAALVRNLGVAICNGAITLIILLIAPLGLTAVIINTLLVTLASFINAAAGDRIVRFLQPAQIKTIIAEIINQNSIIMNSSQQKQK
ncbi:hypothetical protein IQ231_22605 [Cuspidothrix issatschenkoi LEGE 03284]|uniref:CRISPR-associated protein Csx18 n=1 Tax=Cuspidothrix issatschenkoi TaxID=230752 RepID=UPI001881E5DC|nr:CRISPR-associated protein Csx18 [Cuspidothrix issatschenkoi]MBE9234355.1 hypothetical protein [Cuspidothrix issatschenkoi LEGE 03284]